MARNGVGLRGILLVLALLLTTVASLPATSTQARGPQRKAWPLPKTDRSKYRGRKNAPPTYTPIPLGKLNDTFGDVVTIEPTPISYTFPDLNLTRRISDHARAVIGNDDRTLVKDTNYPWSAMGRLLWSDGTYCTASLVGDRFVLTASHCIPWNDPSISIVFQPDYFDTEVFGHAQVTDIAYVRKNDAANFDSSACGVYYDYAIMRLDTVLSPKIGTLGVTQWNSTLVNTPLKAVGYPFDIAAGARPYVQAGIQSVTSSGFSCAVDGPLMTKADSSSGQSGGPLFIPAVGGTRYVVGVLSASGPSETDFASGSGMVELVAWGKAQWPA